LIDATNDKFSIWTFLNILWQLINVVKLKWSAANAPVTAGLFMGLIF
jgi:hypothetical protein